MRAPDAPAQASSPELSPTALTAVRTRAQLAATTLHLHVLIAGLTALVAAWGAALFARIEVDGYDALAPSAELCASLWSALSQVQAAAWLAAGVAFLRWLRAATALTRAVATPEFRWSPAESVWSFFIPVLSIARPYQVMRDLRDALAPGSAPLPPVAREEPVLGYRDAALTSPTTPGVPTAPVGAWWAAFLITSATASPPLACGAGAVAQATTLAAAVLGARVVRGVTARLTVRHLRMRAAR